MLCTSQFLSQVLFAETLVAQFHQVHFSQSRQGKSHCGLAVVDSLNQRFTCLQITKLYPNDTSDGTVLLHFPTSNRETARLNAYRQCGAFTYVHSDVMGHGHGKKGNLADTPTDTYFYRQWALFNNGTFSEHADGINSLPPKIGADIHMQEAWTIEKGSSKIIVAVLDGGVKWDHPEFAGRIWNNAKETPNNGIDDDGNGFVDDEHGWNFSNNQNVQNFAGNNNVKDSIGHGTNVAGIIGSNGNNNMGYAGVDWNCKIMPVKVLNDSNVGYYSWWAKGIHYAVDNGARVINISAGGTDAAGTVLKDAINYALSKKVTVVVSIGNDNSDIHEYPAAYPGVIAVGATEPNDTRVNGFFWDPKSGSNWGSHISLCAPGNFIYGLASTSNAEYDLFWGGTSQAAPHVSGVVALLLAQDSTLTPAQIKNILEVTADDQVGNPLEDKLGFDPYYGHGRLNAGRALAFKKTTTKLTIYRGKLLQTLPPLKSPVFNILGQQLNSKLGIQASQYIHAFPLYYSH